VFYVIGNSVGVILIMFDFSFYLYDGLVCLCVYMFAFALVGLLRCIVAGVWVVRFVGVGLFVIVLWCFVCLFALFVVGLFVCMLLLFRCALLVLVFLLVCLFGIAVLLVVCYTCLL